MEKILVIIPCGERKIWKKTGMPSSYPAKNAYIGSPFIVNRRYAESIGDRWVILSARYGFIDPDTMIEDYNETFKTPTARTVTVETLQKQVLEKGLANYPFIIGLGGKEYLSMIQKSFAGTSCRVEFPFANLSLFEGMSAIKAATCSKKTDSVIIL